MRAARLLLHHDMSASVNILQHKASYAIAFDRPMLRVSLGRGYLAYSTD